MTRGAYKLISLCMAVVFGVVGLIFLFMSADVLRFFNTLSGTLGMEEVIPGENHFYAALAVAYMYLVTLLAALMYLHPDRAVYPLLLLNGKFASSIASILFFVFDKHLLIFLTNGVVDGLIGLLVVAMYRSIGRVSR